MSESVNVRVIACNSEFPDFRETRSCQLDGLGLFDSGPLHRRSFWVSVPGSIQPRLLNKFSRQHFTSCYDGQLCTWPFIGWLGCGRLATF